MEKQNYNSEIQNSLDLNVYSCYQCGKCSAGCATAEEMDYPPSMVMRMLQTNDDENFKSLLKSETIWLCVSCENCVTRCPMQIDIPALMDYMRQKAYKANLVNKKSSKIVSFHKAFLDSIRATGRLFEIGLVANYKLRTFNIIQDMDIAPRMFAKGKLPLLPEMIKDKKQISNIFNGTMDAKDEK